MNRTLSAALLAVASPFAATAVLAQAADAAAVDVTGAPAATVVAAQSLDAVTITGTAPDRAGSRIGLGSVTGIVVG